MNHPVFDAYDGELLKITDCQHLRFLVMCWWMSESELICQLDTLQTPPWRVTLAALPRRCATFVTWSFILQAQSWSEEISIGFRSWSKPCCRLTLLGGCASKSKRIHSPPTFQRIWKFIKSIKFIKSMKLIQWNFSKLFALRRKPAEPGDELQQAGSEARKERAPAEWFHARKWCGNNRDVGVAMWHVMTSHDLYDYLLDPMTFFTNILVSQLTCNTIPSYSYFSEGNSSSLSLGVYFQMYRPICKIPRHDELFGLATHPMA